MWVWLNLYLNSFFISFAFVETVKQWFGKPTGRWMEIWPSGWVPDLMINDMKFDWSLLNGSIPQCLYLVQSSSTSSLKVWYKDRICWCYKTGKSGWYTNQVHSLPSKGTSAGWRGGLMQTSCSLTKKKCKLLYLRVNNSSQQYVLGAGQLRAWQKRAWDSGRCQVEHGAGMCPCCRES